MIFSEKFHFLPVVQEILLVAYILITFKHVFLNIYYINITSFFIISATLLSFLLLLFIYVSFKKYILLVLFRLGFVIVLIMYMLFFGSLCKMCLNYHLLIIIFTISVLIINKKFLANVKS